MIQADPSLANEPNPQSLVDKVALITGAAHRIGAEIARVLHAQGADIVIHYRNSLSAAKALRRELEAIRPSSVLLMGADLRDCHLFPALMARVQDFRGRLDILVNNASSFYPTPFDLVDEDQWDDLMASNLKGPFFWPRPPRRFYVQAAAVSSIWSISTPSGPIRIILSILSPKPAMP